ncbi:MAG: hypothetical protein Q7S95_02310 [bacterium]|nr:hypothetical protein [bacterium]
MKMTIGVFKFLLLLAAVAFVFYIFAQDIYRCASAGGTYGTWGTAFCRMPDGTDFRSGGRAPTYRLIDR